MAFPKKTPDEIKLATFDFSTEAATGSVLSNASVTVTEVVSGTGNVNDVDVGTPAINGQTVEVLLGSGVDGCKYRIKCEVDADNGEHHEIDKDLPVSVKAALV